MNVNTMFSWVIAGVIVLATIPATAFPVLYAIKLPWRSSMVGKALMMEAVGLMLLVDLSAVHLAGVEVPDWLRTVVYLWVSASLYYQLIVLILIRREFTVKQLTLNDDSYRKRGRHV